MSMVEIGDALFDPASIAAVWPEVRGDPTSRAVVRLKDGVLDIVPGASYAQVVDALLDLPEARAREIPDDPGTFRRES